MCLFDDGNGDDDDDKVNPQLYFISQQTCVRSVSTVLSHTPKIVGSNPVVANVSSGKEYVSSVSATFNRHPKLCSFIVDVDVDGNRQCYIVFSTIINLIDTIICGKFL